MHAFLIFWRRSAHLKKNAKELQGEKAKEQSKDYSIFCFLGFLKTKLQTKKSQQEK